MYIKEASDQQDKLSLSQNFELACQAILTELQSIIPCDVWLIAFREQQWHLLYAYPSDGVDVAILSQDLDALSHQFVENDDNYKINSNIVGAPIRAHDSMFDGVICGKQPHVSSQVLHDKYSYIKLLSKVISYQLDTEIKLNQKKYKIQQLVNLSHTDSLTQLLNHRAWSQLLMVEEARAKRYEQAVTIFIIDLDKLKVVNDTRGHHAGDQLIIKAANCLRDVCRESDLVARLGGDEFGLLAIECDEQGADVLSNNITQAFDEALIDASFGYCVMTKNLGILEAVNLADKKMYQQKNHKNRSASFNLAEPSTEIIR